MKRKTNKALAFLLSAIMCFSNLTPIFADNTTINSIGSKNQEDDGVTIGVDETQAQTTTYSEELQEETKENTFVYVSQASTFSVIIPKVVILDGETKNANYVVSVSGNIGGEEKVFVIPEDTFKMQQTGKDDIIAEVTQDKDTWLYNELDVKGNGSIVAEDMTAGSWKGQFNFNILLDSSPFIEVIAIDNDNNNDLNAKATLITNTEKNTLIEKLISENYITNKSEIARLINVETDSFANSATATFNVSNYASTGDKIAIYHYDETNNTWEYIDTCVVDENGKISANFTSFSPVALVAVEELAGLYDANGVMLCAWEDTGINVEQNYTNSNYKTDTASPYYVVTNNYPDTTKIILPNNVTTIGENAFRGNTYLKEIEISKSVTTISDNAFNGAGLTSVTIPQNVTSLSSNYGYAFSSCSNLQSVNILANITEIPQGTFVSCSSLTTIKMPDSIEEIKYSGFQGCSSLTEVKLPANVVELGEYAFSGCYAMENVIFNDKLETIGRAAFCYNRKLTEISLPDSVKTIGVEAFRECTNVTSLKLSNNIETIGNFGFYKIAITTLELPNTVTYVGEQAFYCCPNLKTVVIPSSVKTIDDEAFNYCYKLESVTLNEGLETIGELAFAYGGSLKELAIPNSVTSIGNNAFQKVTHITYTGTASGQPWGATSMN